jgi:hypothetical protein
MNERFLRPRSLVQLAALSVLVAACSSSSSPATTQDSGAPHDGSTATDGGAKDTGTATDTGTTSDTGTKSDTGTTSDTGTPTAEAGATTTIQQVRQNSPSGSFTVKGFVTALAGEPNDYPNWYIEDPAGGEFSGIDVYCDPDDKCTVPEPALHDLILVTGTLSPYKGVLEIKPTAMTVIQSNATFPPVVTLTAADIAPSGNSTYRGVYVKLAITSPTKLVVDSVTPTALYDTECATTTAKDGGAADAGPTMCTSCAPPTYSGFQANDGTGNEVYIEAPFFHTDPLQSSPECLTQSGAVPVTVGMTFSSMSGILDYDGYASAQALSPVQPSDYATP